jgi:hypothetical protein
LLATYYPQHPASLATLRHSLADERPEVALQAALALGEEAHGTLLQIVGREQVEDHVAAHAAFALGDQLPVELGLSVLHRSLRLRRLATADACIHALGQAGGQEVAELLAKVLSVEPGPLAVAAARALATSATVESETALLRALSRDDPELVTAVIAALGRVGTAGAVLPIRDAAERSGASAELRRTARQAVAEIQARLHGASPGQLSLADGEAGHLSLADDDPRGRLSLDRRPG